MLLSVITDGIALGVTIMLDSDNMNSILKEGTHSNPY